MLTASAVNAASPKTPTGITVSPAFQQVTIQEGSAEQPIEFSVTNDKSTVQTIHLSTADFNTLDESGGLFFVGTNPTDLQKKYGLAKWLILLSESVTIQPKQTAVIKAKVVNQSTLAAGGHYGAINMTLGESASNSASSSVAIKPVASELLFVTKLGGDTHKLSLANVYRTNSIFKLPNSIELRFRNTGNTHLTPRGTVTITNSRGKIVGKGIINEDSRIILPETYRRFGVVLNQYSESSTFGTYKLTVNFRFDGIDKFRTYESSFTYVPAIYLVGALVVVILAVYAGRRLYRRQHNKKTTHKPKTKKEIIRPFKK